MAETQYFKSSLLAQQMEDIWVGTVRFNAEQELTETQKAQARENIGAVPFGSNLKILGHFNTVAELQASAPQNVGDAYSVGASVPYKLYIFDGLTESWLDYGYIRSQDINARCVQNVAVAKSAWSQDTTALPGYSYKARITLADSTIDSFPIVVFESEQAFSGNFAPMSFAFAGYLEVFAKSIPTKDINIVTATVIVGGGAGKGITNASATIANKSIKRSMLADDALYSPNVHLGASNATFSLSSGSVGKTFIANNSATDFVITVPADASIPAGFEVALFRFSCKSMKITFASGIKVLVYGNNAPLTAPSFTLETYAMVALKKISGSDYWLLTGPAEVV
jgi:hypothetical protein